MLVHRRMSPSLEALSHESRHRVSALLLMLVALSAGPAFAAETPRRAERAREPVVGLPCEGCEAVFEGLPDSLEWSVSIAGADEPGERLRIDGVVRHPDGRPAPGIIVYAYHTDDRGIYPADAAFRGRAAGRHGRLRGWVRTDAGGRYRFDTIRPAGYPDTPIPAHVHMHVIEPGRCTYFIDDIHFEDDRRLTPAHRRQLGTGRGGPGLVTPVRDASGAWSVTRPITLGENIPGHGQEP